MSNYFMCNKVIKGRRSESIVLQWLQQKGFQIIQQNYQCKFGEIDIVVSKESQLYLVEVRSRFINSFENTLDEKKISYILDEISETITRSKRSKIIRTGYYYLNTKAGKQFRQLDLQIMVVLLVWRGNDKAVIRKFALED